MYLAAPPRRTAAPVTPAPDRAGRAQARGRDTGRAPAAASIVAWLDYANHHGPINTGITAAVKRLEVRCAGRPRQVLPVVMPHSEGWQAFHDGSLRGRRRRILHVCTAAGLQHE